MGAPTTAVRLSTEEVPAADRGWVERALIGPINRILLPLGASIQRLPLAQVNMQVLEWRGLPPSTSHPAEFLSTLSGRCVGVSAPIYVRILQNGSEELVSVGEGGGLCMPRWQELTPAGESRSRLRILSQPGGLSATSIYVIRWQAWGA